MYNAMVTTLQGVGDGQVGQTMRLHHLAHQCMFFSLLLILFTNTYFIYIDFATMYSAMVTTSQGVGDGQMGQTM